MKNKDVAPAIFLGIEKFWSKLEYCF